MTFFRTAGGEFAALCNVTIRLIELILRLVICSISSSQTIELKGKFRKISSNSRTLCRVFCLLIRSRKNLPCFCLPVRTSDFTWGIFAPSAYDRERPDVHSLTYQNEAV